MGVKRYIYRLKSTGHNSRRYGPCEVCGKHAPEVYYQVEGYRYKDGITHRNCQSFFGHKDCLEKMQRK